MTEQANELVFGVTLRAIIKSGDPRILDEPLGVDWNVYDVNDKDDMCRLRADTVIKVPAPDRFTAVTRALELETPKLGLDAIPHDVSYWVDEFNPGDVSVIH